MIVKDSGVGLCLCDVARLGDGDLLGGGPQRGAGLGDHPERVVILLDQRVDQLGPCAHHVGGVNGARRCTLMWRAFG